MQNTRVTAAATTSLIICVIVLDLQQPYLNSLNYTWYRLQKYDLFYWMIFKIMNKTNLHGFISGLN